MSDIAHQSPDLLKLADQRLPQMLDDLQQLIQTESPSKDLEAVARGAAEAARIIEERLDATPETLEIDGVTHLRLTFGDAPPKVVLLCHQDTVWPVGTLERLPCRVTDDVVRGPGSYDMLGGTIMAIHAAALAKKTGPLDGLCLLVTGDEELGSTSSQDLMVSTALQARAVLVFEGAGAGGTIKVGRKGVGMYTVKVHGRAAHAGLEPWKGVNALLELTAQLPAITALAAPDKGTSVTPTVFGGGTTSNTVPAYAEVALDVRATSMAELERVDTQLRALVPTLDGAAVTVEGEINRPPMERAMAEGLYHQYAHVSRELDQPVPEPIEVGGASDGNFTAGAGIPTLDGLGAVGDGAHADHEHVLIDPIVPRTAVAAALIRHLL